MSTLIESAFDGFGVGNIASMIRMRIGNRRERAPWYSLGHIRDLIADRRGIARMTVRAFADAPIPLVLPAVVAGLFVPIARFLNRRNAVPPVVLGAAGAVTAWLFNRSMTLPLLARVSERPVPMGLFTLGHVLYGIALTALFGAWRTADQSASDETGGVCCHITIVAENTEVGERI